MSHRHSRLKLQAFVGGHLDTQRFGLNDYAYAARLRLLLGEFERQNEIELKKLEFQKHLAFVQCAGQTTEFYEKHCNRIHEIWLDLRDLINNWQSDRGAVARAASNAWHESFGDPNDPKVAEEIDRVANALRKQRLINKGKL